MSNVSEHITLARDRVLATNHRIFASSQSQLWNRVSDKAAEELALLPEGKKNSHSWNDITDVDTKTLERALKEGGSRWHDLLKLIALVFSDADPRTSHDTSPKSYFSFLLFGDEISKHTEHAEAKPSATRVIFQPVSLPAAGNSQPSKFFDAKKCGLEAIADDLDIRREAYFDGVKPALNGILELLGRGSGFSRVYIQGTAGSGKSTLLNRVMFELASRPDVSVVSAKAGLVGLSQFTDELTDRLQGADLPTVICFDDILRFRKRGVDVQDFDLGEIELDVPVVFIMAENWSIQMGRDPTLRSNRSDNEHIIQCSALSKTEIDQLASKITGLELEGKLVPRPNSEQHTREEQVAALKQSFDRKMISALLRLRHGRSVGEFLHEEFVAIQDENARLLYARTVLFSSFGLGLPASAANKLKQEIDDKFSIGRFEQDFFEIVDGFYNFRHETLIGHAVQALYPDEISRGNALSSALAALDFDNDDSWAAALSFFQSPATISKLKLFTGHSPGALRSLLTALVSRSDNFEAAGLGSVLHAFVGQAYNASLHDVESAKIHFEIAIEKDSTHGFPVRQRAWIAAREGDWPMAEAKARKAFKLSSTAEQKGQCAEIISWCSDDGFSDAGKMYLSILDDAATDAATLKRHENYLDAAAYKEIMLSSVDSVEVLGRLCVPSSIWKSHGHLKKQVGSARFSELANNLHNATIGELDLTDVDQEYVEFNDPELKKDRGLTAMLKATVGRLFYSEFLDSCIEGLGERALCLLSQADKAKGNDPWILTWLGSTQKDVSGDFEAAKSSYEKAINYAARSKNEWIKNHPIFENNLGLLYLHGVQTGRFETTDLELANKYVGRANEKAKAHMGLFDWPERVLAEVLEEASHAGISLTE